MTLMRPSFTGLFLEEVPDAFVREAGYTRAAVLFAGAVLALALGVAVYAGWKWWRNPRQPALRARCRQGMFIASFLAFASAIQQLVLDLAALTEAFAIRNLTNESALFDQANACILRAFLIPLTVAGLTVVLAVLMGLPNSQSRSLNKRLQREGNT
ncbi:MAG: hypothetical protein U1F77_15240 [Kiritimatiellia bacterium]